MKKIIAGLILCHLVFISSFSYGDDADIFSTSVQPDTLIILDLTGSMLWTPAGSPLYANNCNVGPYYPTSGSGYPDPCDIDPYDTSNNPIYGDSTCEGPYYKTSGTGHTTNCSRLAIAKRAVRGILDYDQNGTINADDEKAFGVRIGYMRYYNCYGDDTGGNYDSGCIILRKGIGTSYSEIYTSISGEGAFAGTPLASAMYEGKLYLDAHKAGDSAQACRQKFAIVITDGEDTFACGAPGSESTIGSRRKTVANAKALADAGYRVFMIGFGANMPAQLQNTLNWAAYFGGTDNPAAAKSGDTGAVHVTSSPCNSGDDPGAYPLKGYAFIASKASDLSAHLKKAFNMIRESIYSFSVTSVAASRTTAENYMYEASFKPIMNDPFWRGYLRKYGINSDGTVGSMVWDAGTTLKDRDPAIRNIFTYRSGAFFDFKIGSSSQDNAAAWRTYLAASSDTQATQIVGYIRGEATFNPENWKLGDIFHSNPIFIGGPSAYYTDPRSTQAFVDFRNNNANRERLVVVGANDGQLRGFQANSSDGTEKWSFIPPNLLQKLQYIVHTTDPAPLSMKHTYFADGPITVADVWLGSGDGTSKSWSDWKTMLVFGEGKGVRDDSNNTKFLWSSSSSCDSNFNNTYDSTFRYYCGYYALNVTATAASRPTFMWVIKPNSDAEGKYLGEPWSRMAIGRVKIGGNEKWVGFMGGGYGVGKAFFVVDLSNGNILWSYTKDNADVGVPDMSHAIPASPAVVDTDNDGFIDTAYVGDLNGNLWKFKFCKNADGSSCNTSNWQAKALYQSSVVEPIYLTPAVTIGSGGSIWALWGTGDREDPTNKTTNNAFYAAADDDLATPLAKGDFDNLTQQGKTYSGKKPGWSIDLAQGEKIFFNPAVFGGIVVFTTYTPAVGTDPCAQSGTAKLYAIAIMRITINGITYDPGAGVLSEPADKTSTGGGERSIVLGPGMAKSPVFSQKPGAGGPTDLYVSISGGETKDTEIISTSQLGDSPLKKRLEATAPSGQVIHWKDGRIQP